MYKFTHARTHARTDMKNSIFFTYLLTTVPENLMSCPNVTLVYFAQFRSTARWHVLYYCGFLNISSRLTSDFEGCCWPAGRSFPTSDLRLLYSTLQTLLYTYLNVLPHLHDEFAKVSFSLCITSTCDQLRTGGS